MDCVHKLCMKYADLMFTSGEFYDDFSGSDNKKGTGNYNYYSLHNIVMHMLTNYGP